MSSPRYSDEFKSDAVRQVIDRGYSVMEVAKRIGVSENSLYKWVRASKKASPANDKLAKMRLENQRLKAELRRVQEERGILTLIRQKLRRLRTGQPQSGRSDPVCPGYWPDVGDALRWAG